MQSQDKTDINSIEKPKQKNYNIFKLVLIIVNAITILIILYLEFSKGSLVDFADAMSLLSNNLIWLLGGLIIIILKIIADSFSYFILIKDTTGENRFWLAFKVCVIGRYGDFVTPLSTGGQPFQIYYLYKYNIELSKAASIPMARVVVRILGYNATMLIFFIFFPQQGNDVIKTVAFVGLAFNSLFPALIIFLAINKTIVTKLTDIGLKLGYKFKIIKNLEESRDHWQKKVADMMTSIKYFTSHPKIFISVFLLSAIDIICLATVPYFVLRAFGGDVYDWVFVATSAMYVMSASVIAPTPGTSGMAEASFYTIFATIFSGGIIFYGLITWRILTFYLFILMGIVILIYESFYKKKAGIDLRDESLGRVTNRQRTLQEKNDVTKK